MPNYIEIIWTVNAALLGWILTQYFKLRKEISFLNLSLVKNYATNEAIEKLIANQDKMLENMLEIKVAQATIFERIERYHDSQENHPVQTEFDWSRPARQSTSSSTKTFK